MNRKLDSSIALPEGACPSCGGVTNSFKYTGAAPEPQECAFCEAGVGDPGAEPANLTVSQVNSLLREAYGEGWKDGFSSCEDAESYEGADVHLVFFEGEGSPAVEYVYEHAEE